MGKILPTVKIEDPNNPKDYVIINESDFDASIHKEWKGKEKAESKGDGLDSKTKAELTELLPTVGLTLEGVEGTGSNGAVKNSDMVDAIRAAVAAKEAAEETE